jgi:putative hydrolase of the HAD superfamily
MPVVRYKAVLCDIDGVLRHWPPAADLELAHGLPPGTLAAAAFAPGRLLPAITGQITDEEWRASVEAAIAGACGSPATARSVVTAWSDQLPAVDAEVAALLRTARRSMPVALVSNATTRLEHDLRRQGLDDIADVVVNTSRIGWAKPDPRVYAIAARRVRVPVHQCLFIDDTAANVTAARDFGMPAIHYRQPSDLRDALTS